MGKEFGSVFKGRTAVISTWVDIRNIGTALNKTMLTKNAIFFGVTMYGNLEESNISIRQM